MRCQSDKWNRAEIGQLVFVRPGLHLLTFRYNAGNNFAYFDFEREHHSVYVIDGNRLSNGDQAPDQT